MADDIRDALEKLHHLQDRLAELNGRLRRGPVLLKTQENNIQKAGAKLAQVKAEHQKLLAEAKQKENEVAAHDQQIAKRKTQLAEAKTNKDYQALQLQIDTDINTRSVMDDTALEAIMKAEQFAANIPPVEEEVKKYTELYETSQRKINADKPKLEEEIAEFTSQLRGVEVLLPKDFRDIYERLVRTNGGGGTLAVVANNKYCGGCNLQIPINSLALILAKKPVVCSSCGRLLYVPKDYEFDKG
jgi:predicted  nucleic acid-binding Zn-ribbon protein